MSGPSESAAKGAGPSGPVSGRVRGWFEAHFDANAEPSEFAEILRTVAELVERQAFPGSTAGGAVYDREGDEVGWWYYRPGPRLQMRRSAHGAPYWLEVDEEGNPSWREADRETLEPLRDPEREAEEDLAYRRGMEEL